MANYTVITDKDPITGKPIYYVIGMNGPSTGYQVAALDNQDVAIRLAQKETITGDDVRLAVQESIRADGGPQSSPAPISAPAAVEPAVDPVGSPTNPLPSITPKDGGVTYLGVSGGYTRNPDGTYTGSNGKIYINEGVGEFRLLNEDAVQNQPLPQGPDSGQEYYERLRRSGLYDPDSLPRSSIQRQPVTVTPTPSTATTPNQDPLSASSISRQPTPVGYTVSADPEGGWAVVNAQGVAVETGLTEQQALLKAQEQEFIDEGKSPPAAKAVADANPDLNTSNTSNLIREATEADVAEAAQAQAMLDKARAQAVVSNYRKWNGTQAGDGDWRVRLRLAPNANYLYKTPGINTAGILEPLRSTDGVIFPYTPRIDTQYNADYTPADLVHSNYRSYFYKGSRVGDIIINADFTAQDTKEADYLLAVIHFFKSCTKMFYGQDAERGSPPPLVYLSGHGQYQFNEHPCVIGQFNYNLPQDVDYIRARGRQESSSGVTQGGDGLLWRRTQAKSAGPSYSLSNVWSRLTGANLPKGAINYPPAPPNLGLKAPTYVPTKISISLTLLPIQSRKQVSEQFSLKEFANGNLLKGGYW